FLCDVLQNSGLDRTDVNILLPTHCPPPRTTSNSLSALKEAVGGFPPQDIDKETYLKPHRYVLRANRVAVGNGNHWRPPRLSRSAPLRHTRCALKCFNAKHRALG